MKLATQAFGDEMFVARVATSHMAIAATGWRDDPCRPGSRVRTGWSHASLADRGIAPDVCANITHLPKALGGDFRVTVYRRPL